MTNHRDPIEQWLSRDIELLPPPQGTFKQVRRRARQRKAVQAVSVAAGVAVLVAAGAAIPRLASNLTQGGPASVKTSSPSHRTSSSAKPASPTPRPSPSRPFLPLSSAGSGKRPPAGFRPTSVTFIQQGALGAVIGHRGPSCGPAPCTLIAGIRNYGGHWTEIGAPPAPSAGKSGVSQIRFLDRKNGWAYGPGLWATHDGGRSWSQSRYAPSPVIDLATVSGRVLAVAGAGCKGAGATYAATCTSFTLFRAAANRGAKWQEVTGGRGQVTPGALQLTARYGYLLAGGRLYSGPLGGAWRPVSRSPASPVNPPCLTLAAGHGLIAPTPTSSPNSGTLYLVCAAAVGQQPSLYASGDGGRTWHARGAQGLPASATATSLAVSPVGPLVLATSAGLYFLDARTWRRAAVSRQVSGGFGFVGMTTATSGVAVPVDSGLHEVFITSDGGRSWRRSVIQ